MRIAAIDIGTNTVLLTVGEINPRGLESLVDRATMTRLGKGVDRTRRFDDEALSRTRACLSDYANVVRELGVCEVRVVGTSAARDAADDPRLSRMVEDLFGAPLEILSGEEEAKGAFWGALDELPHEEASRVVLDVGGGSTEVVVGTLREGVTRFVSMDVGSVRLSERCFRHDPPEKGEIEHAREEIARAMRASPLPFASRLPVGIAGTITTLASLSLGLRAFDAATLHGCVVTTPRLEALVDDLLRKSSQERVLMGVEAGRADVIAAGGLITLLVCQALRADALVTSVRGLRYGILRELATRCQARGLVQS